MARPPRALTAPLAALALAGCATLERGTLDDVPVTTDPPGATVTANTGTVCISPCTVTGPRHDTFAITVAKAGFVSQTVYAEAKPDAAAVAAASELKPSLDLPGRVADVQDGAYYGHSPKSLVVKLAPAP